MQQQSDKTAITYIRQYVLFGCIPQECTGVIAVRQPDILLPTVITGSPGGYFLDDGSVDTGFDQRQIITKRCLEFLRRAPVCNAPWTDFIFQIMAAINGGSIDIALALSASAAFRIALDDRTGEERVGMISKGRQVYRLIHHLMITSSSRYKSTRRQPGLHP